jgi:hypothetical protein
MNNTQKKLQLDASIRKRRLSTSGGLLFEQGHQVDLPMADIIAGALGYMSVERLVRYMEGKTKVGDE